MPRTEREHHQVIVPPPNVTQTPEANVIPTTQNANLATQGVHAVQTNQAVFFPPGQETVVQRDPIILHLLERIKHLEETRREPLVKEIQDGVRDEGRRGGESEGSQRPKDNPKRSSRRAKVSTPQSSAGSAAQSQSEETNYSPEYSDSG
ncbi:F-box protein [Sesbania bispinosa]|nr:F-box protein [Sesbania bispinosa]